MKLIFKACPLLLLAACASAPLDRSEAQKNYLTVEKKEQERSLERADHSSRALALASQVRAIDAQIVNQRRVVDRWKSMPEVPSSPAMIANAYQRIKQLDAEKSELLRRQTAELEKVESLREEKP